MLIPVNMLPSNFKPYPFKSFKMKALTVKQALDLGKSPSLEDLTKLIQTLTDNEIDASLLVPIDLKYLVAMLAFHAYPKQSWTLTLTCPHCKDVHTKTITIKDFPPVPSLEDKDPYPLTIDDGTHIYELGYAPASKLEMLGKDGDTDYLKLIAAHTLKIDGTTDNIEEKLLDIEDFGVIATMVKAIQKYFQVDTFAEFECPKCKKTYKVAMSAVEVTQYTPFLDSTKTGKYKTNFRL